MSAHNKHLAWSAPETFSPGLWTADNAITMPATAAQQMDDCMPTIAGGLRAVLKEIDPITNTNLPTDGEVTHYFIRPQSLGFDRYLFILRPSGLELWERDFDEIVWTLRKAHGAGSGGGHVAETFTDAAGANYVVWGLSGPVAERGVWSMNIATKAVVKQMSDIVQLVAVRDDIIITAIPSTGTAFGNTLKWSASQSVSSWPDSNEHPLNVSLTIASIQVIKPSWPSDLMIGFGRAPWMILQGLIEQPLIRSMSDSQEPGEIQKGVFTEAGIAFTAIDSSVFITSDGAEFNEISEQIDLTDFTEGQLAYLDRKLYVPGGLVYDFETQSWFKMTVNSTYHFGDARTGNFSAANETNGVITFKNFYEYVDSPRVSTYTWKGAPLHADDGRQTVIREIQLYATTHDSNSVLAVTVAGETKTHTIASAGTEQHSFRFLAGRGEVVDIKIVATAGNSDNEAPTLEKPPRMGIAQGHLLP